MKRIECCANMDTAVNRRAEGCSYHCRSCGKSGESKPTVSQALEAWNVMLGAETFVKFVDGEILKELMKGMKDE